MRLTARDIFSLPAVEVIHKDRLAQTKITGVSTDSRTASAGNLFVALIGERFDGHAFLQEVAVKGVAAAVVRKPSLREMVPELPLIVVEDTLRALGELARAYRRKFSIPLLAVAGSNGKTTTREMIGSVLRSKYTVLVTEGNLNNQIGVPQTLFRMGSRHDVAVVEIGTNHPGEIAALCEILEPTHGVITNIGKEHLEFLGSLDGVAEEEGALFDSLRSSAGATAFVNADDQRIVGKARHIKQTVTYAFRKRTVTVRGRRLQVSTDGRASFEFLAGGGKNWTPVHLRVPGAVNARNALAAAAVGVAFRVPARAIQGALQRFRAVGKRMEVLRVAGITVFNDTYNANPDSTLAALEALARVPVRGKRIAVLGDMLELGEAGPGEHEMVGAALSGFGIDYLLTYGKLGKLIGTTARVPFIAHYDQKNMLAEYLAELATPGDVVLVKGSRALRMEDIVTFLLERRRSDLGGGA